jgi:threonine/homoserine/homoserine lactone efflux protein
VLGGVQVVIAVVGNGLFVLAAAGLAGFLARHPGWARAQRLAMGGALGGFGIKLLTARA